MKKYLVFIVILIGLILTGSLYIRDRDKQTILAFPTAEGGGANSIGGRGGEVMEVTNLKSEGEGSLRFACESNGSRTVVFRVGGTIDLGGKDIIIKDDNITIAGQTATGDGIQIKNGGLVVNASEVIIRYLRLRLGGNYPTSMDALRIASPNRHNRKKNIIVDHVSAFWGVDETVDAGSFNDNVTIQWSIIAEGLHCSIYNDNGKGESWKPCRKLNGKSIWAHSRGIMVTEDSHNITLHHNLIYRNYKRNPLIQSSDVDVVNNVIINKQYQIYIQPFKASVKVNFIGNYFRSYMHKRPPIRVYDYNKGYDSRSGVYYKNNYDSVFRAENHQSETDIRILHFAKDINDSDGHVQDMNRAYSFTSINIQNVHEAYKLVLDNVGANYPKRDNVDERVINAVKSGTSPKSFVNNPKEVGGWAILKDGAVPIDSDHDGMPDIWEKENGLNPQNSKDGSAKKLNDVGYTNLEVYINSLVK